jgi:hypothetical protein
LVAAVDADFIDEVKRELHPGMTAVIVEANEGSTRAVDDLVDFGLDKRPGERRALDVAAPPFRRAVTGM